MTSLQLLCQLRMSDQGDPILTKPIKIEKTNKKKEPKRERGDPLFADSSRAGSEILEWLQEFREILVDDEIPEHGDSHASSSHEASLEPILKRREDLVSTATQPGISMQNEKFTRNPEKLAKVPGTREETKSHLH